MSTCSIRILALRGSPLFHQCAAGISSSLRTSHKTLPNSLSQNLNDEGVVRSKEEDPPRYQSTPRKKKTKKFPSSQTGKGTSKEGEEDGVSHRWHTDPRKLKQLRYSRHILNLVKKSQQSEAVQVLEQMKRARVKPDVVVYNAILSGYARQGDAKMAFKTFNEVHKVIGGKGWG